MGYWMLRRTKRRLLVPAAVLVAVVALAAGWIEAGRTDPSKVPRSRWHELATRSAHAVFAPLPAEHDVAIAPVPATVASRTALVLQRLQRGRNLAQRGGNFDPETGRITILSEEARLEAGMPPLLQPHFVHVLRHEYGHALLADWLDGRAGAEAKALLEGTSAGGVPKSSAYPAPLGPVIQEFQAQRGGQVYGDEYFTSTFDEYFAESYARVLDGDAVPDGVGGFLRSLTVQR